MVFERAYSELPGLKNTGQNVPLELIEYTNSLAYGDMAEDPLVVVFAPGMFASKESQQPVIEEMVRKATDDGRAIRLVTFKEPATPNAYDYDKMGEVLEQVILDAPLYHRGNVNLHVVGHSSAAAPAARATRRLLDYLPNLASFTAYVPTGDRATAYRRDWLDHWGTIVEDSWDLRYSYDKGAKRTALAVGACLVREAFRRARQSLSAPAGLKRAIDRSFYHDPFLKENVSDFNEAGVITNAVYAQKDGSNHYGSQDRDLVEAGFQNLVVLKDTSHLGSVTKPSSGAELMRVIMDADNLFVSRRLGALSLAAA